MGKTVSLEFRADNRFEPVLHNGKSRMTLVSLDAGEKVDTHRALVPATAIVVEGKIKFWAGDEEFELRPGEAMIIDAQEPHALQAIEKSTVIVTRLANPEK